MHSRNILYKITLTICIATASAVAMSFATAPEKKSLVISFENAVGNGPLTLDTVTYKNISGQKYTVTNFKYYVSNISLRGDDGKDYPAANSYYLIRQDDPSTWTAALEEVPAGNYKSISFTIGVDSLHNCSGAQSGALDPANGMFWAWNTGYIFLKLEGKSPSSKSPGGIFEYHIGGYKKPANCIRTVTIDLEGPGVYPNMIDKYYGGNDKKKMLQINIYTDVAKIIDGSSPIDISKLSSVTDYHHAEMVADNYKHMFSLSHIRYGF